MAYIGRELTSGNYLKLDDISSQFNGSTTTFNLTSGGSAFYPGSAFSVLVSLGGVIQEPDSSYQINQNQITFAIAPQASDDFFCIVLGVSLGIGVPGEQTVTGNKLSKPFNYDNGLLYLNDTNNYIGINTTSPRFPLEVGNIGAAGTTLWVNGNTRITGILTVGSSSITIDGDNNQVNVGTGVTIHHTNGVQVGSNTLHSTGLTLNNINITGVSTFASIENLNISGVGTFSNLTVNGSTVVGSAVTINSSGINVTGIITATDFNTTSDLNLKENVQTFASALDVVSELRGVRFDWKKDHKPSVGVIAQELEEVLPELVSNTSPKTVNYNGIIGVLIEAIKELSEEVKNLKNQLNTQ